MTLEEEVHRLIELADDLIPEDFAKTYIELRRDADLLPRPGEKRAAAMRELADLREGGE